MYIIDNGQTGWVKVIYNRSDEKELPMQNGFAVARIGPDLKLFTRSRMNPSWEGAQFYYQTADGQRIRLWPDDNAARRIWAEEKTTGANGEAETFFVGDEGQFSKLLHFDWAGDGHEPDANSSPGGSIH